MLGLDDAVSAGLGTVRVKVKIAGPESGEKLRGIAAWGDAHSVVGSTVRQSTPFLLDIEATSV